MPSRSLSAVVLQLRTAIERGGGGRTDAELLTQFLNRRDEDALAALVERHAPMVWGVCRRVLRHPHDAEDAFQATFLVLVQKAATVVPREMVANWLHGVAQQTAVRMRATAAKRGWREVPMDVTPEPAVAENRDEELLSRLDEELGRLPERCRALIVMCDLEGRTRKEVARQLGCPEGTVASGLARARALLAKRLTRRGLAVSGGSLAATLSHSVASADVPASVVTSAINVATLLAAGKAAGVISGPVATLTQGVLKTMFLKKILATTMAVLALGVAVIVGGSLAVGQTEGTDKPSDKPPAAAEKPTEKPPAAAEKPLVVKVAARDVVVNTPTILGNLQGEWELQPKVESEYKQQIRFTTGNSGSWQRSEGTLPVTITYYVEGQELLIQHNYEPNGAFNYRLKQLRFEYAISNDKSILTLTAGDKTQTWKRIPKANPKREGEKVAPEKEPFTAWGKEVGGLQAGLGFKAGEKRVYTHGEKVTLVVRVRNVGKEEVTFEYLKQFLIETPPTVADADGKTVRLTGVTRFGTHTPVKVSLAPGREVELHEWTPDLRPASEKDDEKPNHSTLYGTGKFQIQYGQVLGQSSSGGGFMKLDPVLGKLATGKLELEVKEPEKLPPSKEALPIPKLPASAAPPVKPKPNYVTVVGQLLDDATGQPIKKAGWEWGMADPKKPDQISWGYSRSMGNTHPGGKFEKLVHFTPDGRFDRLRVYSAGYETTDVVLDLPDPRPVQVERTVRMKRGRGITGVLRDHVGKPVANGWVFFIPKGHRTNIIEGITGADAHSLPKESRDGAVAEVRTNGDGTFALSAGADGTLAASTDQVDLWPFPLPADGYADLKMPAPAYLVIDLTYWYLDDLAKKGKRELSPHSEDPNQCWLHLYRESSNETLWNSFERRRQMLVFAKDPRAKLSKGVTVEHVHEGEWDKPIPGVGHNKNLATKIRVALPPGSYRVQRLRAGPFAPVGEQQVTLKAGEDTKVSWARGDGSSVRGKATWPADMMFVRQPGEAPRKLDWTVPSTATVWIAPVGADGKEGPPIEAAKIQADGSFFIATNLDPGMYKATARVTMPESDHRRMFSGYRGPDCIFSQDFTVPDPARGPFGSPPVEVEIKLPVTPNGRFVAADQPKEPQKEPFTAWGKEVGGLQAGLGFKAGEKRAYRHGETVTLVVRVRNVVKNPLAASTLTVTDKYIPGFYFDWPPTLTDGDGKAVAPICVAGRGGDYNTKELNVEPGKEVELAEVKLELRSERERGDKGLNTLYGTGKYQVHYQRLMYGSGKWAISSILNELGTGKLELEVKEAPTEKPKALSPEEAIKIAGDSELTKKFNANKPAVEFKVEFVTKAIQVKVSGEKDAAWVHGHSPNDVCLGTVVAADDPLRKTRFVAILTQKVIGQLNKAGIDDLEKHFKGKTVRVIGPISRHAYDGEGSPDEVEIVLDDMSQLEVLK